MMTIAEEYTQWLLQYSMLKQVKPILSRYSGKGDLWQRPYAKPRPHDATSLASVWFTAYPAAMINAPGKSVLATMGDEALWARLCRDRHSGHAHWPVETVRRHLCTRIYPHD